MRVSLLVAVLLASPAFADPVPEVVKRTERRHAVGFRVGGYGFRHAHGEHAGWTDCRMNGLGLYGQRGLVGPLFAEAAADVYFAHPHGEGEHEMDRLSGLFTVAGGVRTRPTARVVGYAQLGAGVELTRMRVGEAVREMALPEGFLGVGGYLRAGRFQLGTHFRLHLMGHFPEEGALEPEAEAAAQVQFYVGYEL